MVRAVDFEVELEVLIAAFGAEVGAVVFVDKEPIFHHPVADFTEGFPAGEVAPIEEGDGGRPGLGHGTLEVRRGEAGQGQGVSAPSLLAGEFTANGVEFPGGAGAFVGGLTEEEDQVTAGDFGVFYFVDVAAGGLILDNELAILLRDAEPTGAMAGEGGDVEVPAPHERTGGRQAGGEGEEQDEGAHGAIMALPRTIPVQPK